MTRSEFIKVLEEAKRLLLEEVDKEDLTDCAKEKAYYDIEDAIEHLKENEE